MYYVNKIVGVMMSPSVLLMLISIVCAWRLSKRNSQVSKHPILQTSKLPDSQTSKHPSLQTFLWLALALLWFWLSALPGLILGLSLEREWLVDGEIPTAECFPKADAIVCLGGSVNVATNLSDHVELYTSVDRVWQTAKLYKAGKAPKIFVTGQSTARAARTLLMDFGVPESAITFLEDARNTEEEAKSIEKMLGSLEVLKFGGAVQTSKPPNLQTSILLVTSAFHMRRAKLMFEKYAKGVKVIPAPTDFEATVHVAEGFDPRDLLPGNSYMNEVYLREWIGYLGYKWLRR